VVPFSFINHHGAIVNKTAESNIEVPSMAVITIIAEFEVVNGTAIAQPGSFEMAVVTHEVAETVIVAADELEGTSWCARVECSS